MKFRKFQKGNIVPWVQEGAKCLIYLIVSSTFLHSWDDMCGKLVELSKTDSANTIVGWISLKFDNFLYRHFKRKGNTPANILVQPVENITYDANSTSRFKIMKRHETELKWIKLLQTPYPLGFSDNIYHEGNIRKCRILMFSLCYSFVNVQLDQTE